MKNPHPSKSREPRLKVVRAKKITDYGDIPAAYLEVVKNYANPLLVGPPICDELVELVLHMFTEEEASLVQHIRLPIGKTAKAVAADVHRPVKEIYPLLERLTYEKFVLLSFGSGKRKRYGLMPLVPGVFEMTLIRTSLETLTEWHRRFAELFEALYKTGYFAEYVAHPISSVRYVPVGETIEAHPQALPLDHLEEVLDPYKVFGVGLCQCRISAQIRNQACDRPLETCVAFGDAADFLIRNDKMRKVTKRDVLEIKAEAMSTGLVNFIIEMEAIKNTSGTSCSCCGCCCGALRLITEFNAPGIIAPPHFMPKVDPAKCAYCGQCTTACPTGAMVVDSENRLHQYLPERCIGCGLCAAACNQQHAIHMDANPRFRQPPRNVTSALIQMAPNYLRNVWSVWRNR